MKHLIILFILTFLSPSSAAQDFDPVGYWSFKQDNCNYNINMIHFSKKNDFQLRIQEKEYLPSKKKTTYIYDSDKNVIETSGGHIYEVVDKNTLLYTSKFSNFHQKKLIKCNIEQSKKDYLKEINSISNHKQNLKLCSGAKLSKYCDFEIEKKNDVYHATLLENCEWTHVYGEKGISLKGEIHIFKDAESIALYSSSDFCE